MFLFLPGTLNRTRNFDAHDPYHPYHPYFNLDWSTSIGKDHKDGRDGGCSQKFANTYTYQTMVRTVGTTVLNFKPVF